MTVLLIFVVIFLAWRIYESRSNEPLESNARAYEKLQEYRAGRIEFFAKYDMPLRRLFDSYPEVVQWTGSGDDDLWVMRKEGDNIQSYIGRLIYNDEGSIIGWECKDNPNIRYELVQETLEDQLKIDKISSMLKDNDKVRMYCDLVGSQLLEDDAQAFNSLEALGYTEKRFEAEFYDEAWINAWKKALRDEFRAKSAEYMGEGIFMLQAM